MRSFMVINQKFAYHENLCDILTTKQVTSLKTDDVKLSHDYWRQNMDNCNVLAIILAESVFHSVIVVWVLSFCLERFNGSRIRISATSERLFCVIAWEDTKTPISTVVVWGQGLSSDTVALYRQLLFSFSLLWRRIFIPIPRCSLF